jgi:hypothetical protein
VVFRQSTLKLVLLTFRNPEAERLYQTHQLQTRPMVLGMVLIASPLVALVVANNAAGMCTLPLG